MQAIKAVSQYVIENEAEFISQLKTVWNESKSKSANNGQQEIDEAKKRMAELDAKIQKLYDSAISGLLPERQAQRMIQQYDEEQLMLEKRVEELQGQIQEEEVEKIIADAAARYFRENGISKLPSYKALQAEIETLIQEKNSGYNDYRAKREEYRRLQTVKGNIDQILHRERKPVKRQEQER